MKSEATRASTQRRGTIRRSLGALLKGCRWQVLFLALTSFVGGLLEAGFLLLATRAAFAITNRREVVDLVGNHSVPFDQLLVLAFVTAILRLCFALLAIWQSARLTTDVVARTRHDLAGAYLNATWAVQQSERSGQLQELLTTFTTQGSNLLSAFTWGIASAFNLLALVATAIAIAPVGALAVVVVGLLLSAVLRPIRKVVRSTSRRSADAGMQFAGSLAELSTLGLEMHVFDVQDEMKDRVDNLIERHAHAERAMMFSRGVVPAVYTGLAYIALVGALAALAVTKSSNIATLGAVMLVMLRSLSYAQAVQTTFASIHSGMPFIETLQSKLDHYLAGARREGGEEIGTIGEVALRGVTFAYEPGRPVLKDLTFAIRPHEMVGVVGPSGGGKSTLVQLILGLREPDVGEILADGRPTVSLSRSEWPRKVTFVPQQAHLINGTIEDNIRFMRSDVSTDQVLRAAELASLTRDLESFPEGLDREVGEQGGALSGGQQQRICIARALVEDPDVLVMDEPTSALDVHSENDVRQTLQRLKEDMTIVIIAHRLSTLDICDRIMVIQAGKLQGFDDPRELERSSEFFREALRLSGLR